jgi:hypothetical protein
LASVEDRTNVNNFAFAPNFSVPGDQDDVAIVVPLCEVSLAKVDPCSLVAIGHLVCYLAALSRLCTHDASLSLVWFLVGD